MSVEQRGTPPDVRRVIRHGYALRRRRRVVRAAPIVGGALALTLIFANAQSPDDGSQLVTKPERPLVVNSTVPGPPTVGDGAAGVPGPNRANATIRPRIAPTQPRTATVTAPLVVPRRAPLLVFSRVLDSGQHQILVLPPGTTSARLVVDASDTLNNGHPALSPDGTRIAYATTRGSNLGSLKSVFDIWTIGTDGTDARRLTTSNQLSNAVRGNGADFPTWSPDGRRIAYTDADTNGISHLWTMDADGVNKKMLVPDVAGAFSATWSPRGDQIAFSTYDGGPLAHWIANANSGAARKLSVPDLSQSDRVEWTPDGASLLVVQHAGSGFRNVVVDLATGATRTLPLSAEVSGVVFCGSPTQLIYHPRTDNRDPSLPSRLLLIGLDGSNLTTIETGPINVVDADVSCGRL